MQIGGFKANVLDMLGFAALIAVIGNVAGKVVQKFKKEPKESD